MAGYNAAQERQAELEAELAASERQRESLRHELEVLNKVEWPKLEAELARVRETASGYARLLTALLNTAPSADEFRLMVRAVGGVSASAEALMPRIDRLEEATEAARAALAAQGEKV
jgi:hypothetical protein